MLDHGFIDIVSSRTELRALLARLLVLLGPAETPYAGILPACSYTR